MARSGSSHTSELLGLHEKMWSHHGLFNNGPGGRWPFKDHLTTDQLDYYSAVLDERYVRVGGQEHSGEFLDKYIFTDDPRFNPRRWECIGFKIQYVHFVNMPDLRDYLVRRKDIKIILNTRRNLLEHACAEQWCQRGNSRAARADSAYEFGDQSSVSMDPKALFATFRNLCRYRQDAVDTFDTGERDFFEWSFEDMFDREGGINIENHIRLFDFLEMKPSGPIRGTFTPTPRPRAAEYFHNLSAIREAARTYHGGIFAKYFENDYDPYVDRSWPRFDDSGVRPVMRVADNGMYRHA